MIVKKKRKRKWYDEMKKYKNEVHFSFSTFSHKRSLSTWSITMYYVHVNYIHSAEQLNKWTFFFLLDDFLFFLSFVTFFLFYTLFLFVFFILIRFILLFFVISYELSQCLCIEKVRKLTEESKL